MQACRKIYELPTTPSTPRSSQLLLSFIESLFAAARVKPSGGQSYTARQALTQHRSHQQWLQQIVVVGLTLLISRVLELGLQGLGARNLCEASSHPVKSPRAALRQLRRGRNEFISRGTREGAHSASLSFDRPN